MICTTKYDIIFLELIPSATDFYSTRTAFYKAKIQIRSNDLHTRNFDVTEGVLQGQTVSALLFILYSADFEDFFRSKNITGVNIDGVTDVLILLYADEFLLNIVI